MMTKKEINRLMGIEPTNYEQENKNNMAYWFPLLQMIRMRIPDTILIHTGVCNLAPMIDNKEIPGLDLFIERLRSAVEEIGLPCFLRTGMTSAKHGWKDTCFIESSDKKYLISHVYRLVEYSFMANIIGLPLDFSIWAIRRMIPTYRLFTDFNEMPIAKERRLFIRDSKVVCNHPYWPADCFQRRHAEEKIKELQYLSVQDNDELKAMAEYVGDYFTGYWSVDFLQDDKGKWWLTDMAVGERSYHYPNCEILNRMNTESNKREEKNVGRE